MKSSKIVPKLSLVSAVLMALAGSSASAKSQDEVKAWAATGVRWNAVEKTLDQSICSTDAHTFVSCVRGLQALAGSKNELRVLIPASMEKSLPVEKVLAKFGGLEHVKLSHALFDSGDIAAALKQIKAYNATELVEIQKLFALQGTPGKVDFAGALTTLHASVDPSLEAILIGSSINAFLGAQKDPHTHLMLSADIDGAGANDQDTSFVGIGIGLKLIGSRLAISGTVLKSPAFKAGLHANDIITAVDGKALSTDLDKLAEEVTTRIRGAEGTQVSLTIERKGKLMDFKMVRASVVTLNLEMRMLKDESKKIGYIRYMTFMDTRSCEQMASGIQSLEKQGAKGLILDLRGNPGGRVELATCIAGLFVGPKLITTFRALDPRRGEQGLLGLHAQVTSLPLAILIDAESASASELVSGALQDYQRAWLIGERSFGKGSAQEVLQNDPRDPQNFLPNIDLAQTYARFYQPSGRTNQTVGIQPDFTVHLHMNPEPNELIFQREADLFTNALPPVGTPWTQPRPGEVAKIEACLNKSQIAEKTYAAQENGAFMNDFQLLKAEAVLNCGTK